MPEKKTSEKKRLILYVLFFISIVCILGAIYMGSRIFERVGNRPPPIPRQTNVSLIQDWMTIPFIARSYRVPESELFKKLGIDPETNRRSNLSSIAAKTNQTSQEVINLLKEQISQLQSDRLAPP